MRRSPQRPSTGTKFLPLEMPERFQLQFQLPDGGWMTEANCWARDFERLDDGAYIYSGGSSGLRIRSVERHPEYFIHVDGGGEGGRFTYRIVPLPAVDADS